uniref:(northern house mosquito) hypothetical protein n=1 Tax=Culex pipiens TaxID=7175 RepID=A0A8D8BSJ4_CULPI
MAIFSKNPENPTPPRVRTSSAVTQLCGYGPIPLGAHTDTATATGTTDRPSHGSLLPVPTGVQLGICRWCVLRLAAGSTHTSEHVSSPTWPQQNCTRFVCDKNSLLFKCLMFIRDSRDSFPEP